MVQNHHKKNHKRKKPEAGPDFFAPLSGLTYLEQLEKKNRTTEFFKSAVESELEERCTARRYPIPQFSPKVENIVSLPESLEISHRNKCEFTFGADGNLGFVKRVGVNFHIEPISETNPLVPKAMAAVIPVLKSGLSSFSVYSRVDHSGGLLRTASVRLGEDDKICLMIQIKEWEAGKQEDGEDEVSRLKGVLLEIVEKNRDLNIVSLWLQLNAGLCDASSSKAELLWGKKEGVEMRVCGLDFQVHPMSFFQTNTKACEMLYSLVADWADESTEDKPLLLLDLCCGVGTIGQVLAKQVKAKSRVVGIEMIEEAVVDARLNATRNFGKEASKALRFEAGKVEDVLPKLLVEELANCSDYQVVAIVDPPRNGLHANVLKALRDNHEIGTIIYVSCNPESLAKDTTLLVEPLTDCPEEEGFAVSKPFEANKVVAVDMFPNTAHCEMVLRLAR